mmetsp:Transcript_32117/g.108123  ORF Transcript_32117/g.108123 Transcript_32117/m.108123 type:complete len:250 (-) Transcript_32117:510-1259(-)
MRAKPPSSPLPQYASSDSVRSNAGDDAASQRRRSVWTASAMACATPSSSEISPLAILARRSACTAFFSRETCAPTAFDVDPRAAPRMLRTTSRSAASKRRSAAETSTLGFDLARRPGAAASAGASDGADSARSGPRACQATSTAAAARTRTSVPALTSRQSCSSDTKATGDEAKAASVSVCAHQSGGAATSSPGVRYRVSTTSSPSDATTFSADGVLQTRESSRSVRATAQASLPRVWKFGSSASAGSS